MMRDMLFPDCPVRNILARVGDKIPSMLIYRTYHKCKKASCLMGVGREAFLVLIFFLMVLESK